MTTASASLQVAGNSFSSQFSDQMTQAPPTLLVVRIQDEKPRLAVLVKKICAQGDLTSQVTKEVAHVQGVVDADVAAVVKLVGVKVPALDESLSQHQGWARELCVWK